jgi:hypothetical protein
VSITSELSACVVILLSVSTCRSLIGGVSGSLIGGVSGVGGVSGSLIGGVSGSLIGGVSGVGGVSGSLIGGVSGSLIGGVSGSLIGGCQWGVDRWLSVGR